MKRAACLIGLVVSMGMAGVVQGTPSGFPVRIEALSQDGSHRVVLMPTEGGRRGGDITVYEKAGEGWQERWTAKIANDHYPLGAKVTDDGNYVVLLDSVWTAGSGPEVIGIYSDEGRVARYALWEILGAGFDWGIGNRRIPKSTQGVWWLHRSIVRFETIDGEPLLTIWVDHHPDWLVWRLRTGEMVEPEAEQTDRLNSGAAIEARRTIDRFLATGRDSGLRWGGSEVASAVAFLGQLRDPVDEERLKAGLVAGEIGTRYSYSPSGFFGGIKDWRLVSVSKAEDFDEAWMVWSGGAESLASRERPMNGLWRVENSNRSGALSVKLALPHPPQREGPLVRLMLEPLDDPENRSLRWDVEWHEWMSRYTRPTDVVPITWEYVPAGKYRLEAEWLGGDDDEENPRTAIVGEVTIRPARETNVGRIDLK